MQWSRVFRELKNSLFDANENWGNGSRKSSICYYINEIHWFGQERVKNIAWRNQRNFLLIKINILGKVWVRKLITWAEQSCGIHIKQFQFGMLFIYNVLELRIGSTHFWEYS